MWEAPPVRLPEPRCLLIPAAWCPVRCHRLTAQAWAAGAASPTQRLRAGRHDTAWGTDSTHNIALQKSVIPVWHQPFLFQERWFEVWEGK